MSSTSSLPTRILGGVTVPDTPLITKAINLAQSSLSTPAFNHVMRTWLFGQYIAVHTPDISSLHIDAELHAVAAILHDLGWSSSPAHISPDKRFEVDGANATRSFLLCETEGVGWDTHRLQLAWDAVALHTSPSIAVHKQPEVKACCVGIGADFSGWEGSYGGVMTKEVWEGIVSAFPRNGFKACLVEVTSLLCKTKPGTTYDNFVGDFGVEFGVEGYTLEGKKIVDLFRMMEE
jgi:hypothetical protein